MDKFSTLLVAVDHSEHDREVLRYAVELAVRLHGEVVLVHVVQPEVPIAPAYVGPMAGYDLSPGTFVEDASTYLDELAPLMATVPHRVVVRVGTPGAEILAAAEQEGAALIVMATHGRNALSHLLMGSTTEDVLRHAPVPVLAVRTAILGHVQPAALTPADVHN